MIDEKKLSKEEIALRLVESWGGQSGTPVGFGNFLRHYGEAIKYLKGLEND